MPLTRAASQGGELLPRQAHWPCRGGFCPASTFPSRGHWEPLSLGGQGKPLFPWAPRQVQLHLQPLQGKVALVHKFDVCHSSACSRRSELPNMFFPLSCFLHFSIYCSTAQAAALQCNASPLLILCNALSENRKGG